MFGHLVLLPCPIRKRRLVARWRRDGSGQLICGWAAQSEEPPTERG